MQTAADNPRQGAPVVAATPTPAASTTPEREQKPQQVPAQIREGADRGGACPGPAWPEEEHRSGVMSGSNFYVATIDPVPQIKKFYDDEIVDKYGPKIKGAFTVISDPSAVDRARRAGIKIHWFHSLFDYEEGKKSFNHISALMIRTKNHPNGLPAIQTGGNVGTSSWFISWKILKCSNVALIGLNHGWEEDDPWDLIMRHGLKHISVKIDKNSPTFKKLFPKIFNPQIGKYCILDPIFQFYSTAFKEFISRSPSWLTTINATEGGSIFGDKVKYMTFNEFLKNYKK